jgi:hypothetical protein
MLEPLENIFKLATSRTLVLLQHVSYTEAGPGNANEATLRTRTYNGGCVWNN